MYALTKVLTILSILLMSLAAAGLALPAQGEAASGSAWTPLRVELVFSKYDGEKLTSRLPYTFVVNSAKEPRSTELRMGIEVPVTAAEGAQQYRNVGTNVDCRAHDLGDGSFRLELSVEQSSIYPAAPSGGDGNPLFRTFNSNLIVVLADGGSMEVTSATDMVSGEVSKVSVSLEVLKK